MLALGAVECQLHRLAGDDLYTCELSDGRSFCLQGHPENARRRLRCDEDCRGSLRLRSGQALDFAGRVSLTPLRSG
jgi:hypothetical protein